MFPFNKAKKVLAIAYYNLSVLGRNYLDVLDETKMDTIMDGEGNPFVIPRLKKGKNYRSVEGANEWTFLNVDTTQTFKIRPNYYATESIELNSNQIDTLSNLLFNYELNKKSFYSYEVGCYSPRNAFLFLNEKGKIVGIVEICFECMKMVFSFEEEYGFDGICYERKAAIKSFLAGLGIKYGLETK